MLLTFIDRLVCLIILIDFYYFTMNLKDFFVMALFFSISIYFDVILMIKLSH